MASDHISISHICAILGSKHNAYLGIELQCFSKHFDLNYEYDSVALHAELSHSDSLVT